MLLVSRLRNFFWHKQAPSLVVRSEPWLFALLIICKLWLFFRRFGDTYGFDVGAHVEVLEKLNWTGNNLGVRELFYSYHPPFSFLLTKAIMLLGFSPTKSVQIIALFASVGAFLFFRGALRTIGILHTARGVMLLYIGAAIPLQLFLQTGITMEVVVLFFTSLVLWLSVHIWWEPKGKPIAPRTFNLACALAAVLALALFTKFSAVLLFALPAIVAVLSPSRKGWRGVGLAVATSIVAVSALFPYYYLRYYKTEGSFFPINAQWMAKDEIAHKHERMWAHPVMSLRDVLLLPSSQHFTRGISMRDYDQPRMFDVWRDFWMREEAFFGKMSPVERTISHFYLFTGTLLTLLGLYVFLFAPSGAKAWRRLGWILLFFAFIFTSALARMIIQVPAFGSSKGMYVASAMWAVAFLITEALTGLPRTPFANAEKNRVQGIALIVGLVAWILVNHGVPIYP